MKNGIEKIKRKLFFNLGGFSNPALFRKETSNGVWGYYCDLR